MRNIALRLMYVGTAYHGWHRSVKQTCRRHVCSVGSAGWAGGEGRTRLRQLKLKGIDIAALVFAVLLCVGIGVLRHFGL